MKAIKIVLLYIQRGLVFFLIPTEDMSIEDSERMIAEIDEKIKMCKWG